MKILYLANIRIPTEKAHGIQIMKTCEAFSNLGHEVVLLVPWRFNKIKEDPFTYYGVKENFKIKKIFSVDLVRYGKIGFLIHTFLFSEISAWYMLFKRFDLIYSRDEMPLFFAGAFKKNIVYEAHTPRFNFFIKRFSKIITISNGLKQFYIKKGVDEDKIYTVPDAVDLDMFNILETKSECRKKFNLPINKKIVMYTGHLYDWKGVDILAQSKEFLDENIEIIFVGGLEKDIEKFRKKYNNVSVLGSVLHKDIPYYLKSADVLVLPNSAKSDVSKLYTSPMKLFEYMASGIPIVASDLPSIREILNEENSTFVEADNPEALAIGIRNALNKDGIKAMNDVKEYTWNKRVGMILKVIYE